MLGFSSKMSAMSAMQPTWQIGALLLVAAVAAAMLLQFAVQALLPHAVRQEHTVLGTAIFAVIGTTYAVLLAFMASTAWDQYNAAERLARHEADSLAKIEVAGRALSAEAGRTLREQVRAYLADVISTEWPAMIEGRTLPVRQPLLDRLTRTIIAIEPRDGKQTLLQVVLVTAVDDVDADRRGRRLRASGIIPGLVWIVLFGGGALTIGFSSLLGGPRASVHLVMTAILAASGILVILLIVSLSSPFRGTGTISPEAYEQVLSALSADPPD